MWRFSPLQLLLLSVPKSNQSMCVIDTITTAAYLPNMTGGGVVDDGNIRASALNRTAFNRLAEWNVHFTVTCDAPTRVAVPVGRGTVLGVNVDGYVMRLKQGTFTADGVNVFPVTNGADANWAQGIQEALRNGAAFLSSWSASVDGRPVAFSSLSGTLSVEAVLNRGDALSLANAVPLNGLATLELVSITC